MTLLDLSSRMPLVHDEPVSLAHLSEQSYAVALAPDENVELLRPFLKQLKLIVLHFSVFRDGRAFTQARSLREYEKYTGEIRVDGHVLPDQAAFLKRCGVDSVFVTESDDISLWKEQINRFSFAYQESIFL